MDWLQHAMQQGLELHRAGQYRQAAQLYEQVLQRAPQVPEAWHMLGVMSHQLGKHDLAIRCLQQAIELDPIQAAYHSNLGVVLRTQGKVEQAIAAYRLAILRKPDYVEAFNNLGQALIDLRDFDDAERQLREATRLQPRGAEGWFNLGQLEQARGNEALAIDHYRQAIDCQPNYPAAWNNLAVVLKSCGELAEAEECLRRLLEQAPRLVEAYFNLAQTLHAQGKLAEAIPLYERFVQERPQLARAHNNLGGAWEDVGQVDRAIACFYEALRLQPDMLEAINNLAHAQQVIGRLDEAEANYRRALELDPRHPVVLSNLLFFLNYQPRLTPAELAAEHRMWDQRHGDAAPRFTSYPQSRAVDRPLRVGYVSPDLRHHPVAMFLEPILAEHDASQVQTYLYADVVNPDRVSRTLESLVHSWRLTRWLDHDQLAEQIRTDEIDILVDLAGHTAQGRLQVFARRPAPIQVTYLGYPNTTGLSAIDYRLTDAVCDPPGEVNVHSERLVRLEPSFACFAPPTNAPPPGSAPAQRDGWITFGSLHALSKLNDRVIDLWAEVLRAIPQSRLLLFRDALVGSAVDYFLEKFVARGIARNRLDARGDLPSGARHWDVYPFVDITLDPFPWSGHTTACESIWMGVPVVTLRGDRFAARMVSSMLSSLGHPEWIADTPEAYVTIARRLAGDLEGLSRLRRTLRDELRTSPVCDGPAFTRHLEAAYRAMWRRWLDTDSSPNG